MHNCAAAVDEQPVVLTPDTFDAGQCTMRHLQLIDLICKLNNYTPETLLLNQDGW